MLANFSTFLRQSNCEQQNNKVTVHHAHPSDLKAHLGPSWYLGFQEMGMIKGFFLGFEIFNSGIFFGYENLASFFWVA